MSGLGKRFLNAGYKDPKPLIKVHKKPIIEHVVNLFPDETDFIFICRNEHLEQTEMRKTLQKIMPTGKIIGIKGHKLGPVYAVAQAFDFIEDDEPVITSYCDYFQLWNYQDFKQKVEEINCDGAIPCYTGFHPHLLHEKNLYASCRVDENKYLLEIKEKFSFEKDKSKAYHSGGMYYFRKGKFIKKYFQELMDKKLSLNGEYYISLIYNLLQADGLKTLIYSDISHFCQWGTPQDLGEYLYWEKIFKS